jgi:hypothetical protein
MPMGARRWEGWNASEHLVRRCVPLARRNGF